jgi:hypothetical protein
MRHKKPKPDPAAARIAAEVSEQLNRALGGIDLRTIGLPKKPARRAAPPQRRKPLACLTHKQQTLFDKGAPQ